MTRYWLYHGERFARHATADECETILWHLETGVSLSSVIIQADGVQYTPVKVR